MYSVTSSIYFNTKLYTNSQQNPDLLSHAIKNHYKPKNYLRKQQSKQ